MSFEAIKKQEQEYILHSYGRVDVALSHGKNAEVWDVEGNTVIYPIIPFKLSA